MNLPLNIAHRGASFNAPENTLASFKMAAADGADYIEFDLRSTKDKVLVVFHDKKLNRTSSGKGLLRRKSYEVLTEFDFGSWFHADFLREPIPTLQDVFNELPHIGFNIEIKDAKAIPLLIEFLKNNPKDELIISSFSLRHLKRVKKHLPKLKYGWITARRFGLKRRLKIARKHGLFSIHPEQKLVSQELAFLAERYNINLIPWTGKMCHVGRIKNLLEHDIYGIITDIPSEVSRLKRQLDEN